MSRLSHKICHLLSSALLLRNLTSVLKGTGRNIPDPLRTPPCLLFVVRKVRDKAARKLNRAGRSNEKDDDGGRARGKIKPRLCTFADSTVCSKAGKTS